MRITHVTLPQRVNDPTPVNADNLTALLRAAWEGDLS